MDINCLTDEQIEELYKEYLYISYLGEGFEKNTSIGEMWSPLNFDEEFDSITKEEYTETSEIHKRHRRSCIERLIGKP